MKTQNKIDKIMQIENKDLQILKLTSLALSLFPQSPAQLKVRELISELKQAK